MSENQKSHEGRPASFSPTWQFTATERIGALLVAGPVALLLSLWLHWPLWFVVICFIAVYVVGLFGMVFGVAAWEVRKFKKLGIPWDTWPNDPTDPT